MKLLDAKRLFFQLRKLNRIDLAENHVVNHHRERGYSVGEVLNLVKALGTFHNTNDQQFLGTRFYWRTKDIVGKKVRLVIEFENDEEGHLILVVSAGERL